MILYVGLIRVPVPTGEEQPPPKQFDFDQMVQQASFMFVQTSREVRMARAEDDGTILVKPTVGDGLTEVTPVKLVKAVTTASTAVPLVATSTMCTRLQLQAKKVAADNAGNVFIGLSDLDQGVAELFELVPGEPFEYKCEQGRKLDLAKVYLDADNAADGVVGWYDPV